MTSVVEAITSPQLLTGIIAWLVMIVWVVLAIYKDRINYEAWRLTHVLGFVMVCVLATLHITSVGRMGSLRRSSICSGGDYVQRQCCWWFTTWLLKNQS